MCQRQALRRVAGIVSLAILVSAAGAPAAFARPATAVPGSIAARFFANAQMGGGVNPAVPYSLSWTRGSCAADASYALTESVNGRPPKPIDTTTLTATTVDIRPGKLYRFAVSCGGSAVATTFRLNGFQQMDATYRGAWSTVAAGGAWGGSIALTSARGAAATFTCDCEALAWVTQGRADTGSAKVYVDGVLKATVDTSSGGRENGLILFRYGWSADGTHTIRIVNVATSGHPDVDVDGFLTRTSS